MLKSKASTILFIKKQTSYVRDARTEKYMCVTCMLDPKKRFCRFFNHFYKGLIL
jgi:hypothetical protein